VLGSMQIPYHFIYGTPASSDFGICGATVCETLATSRCSVSTLSVPMTAATYRAHAGLHTSSFSNYRPYEVGNIVVMLALFWDSVLLCSPGWP
jgi:hypothetical protein